MLNIVGSLHLCFCLYIRVQEENNSESEVRLQEDAIVHATTWSLVMCWWPLSLSPSLCRRTPIGQPHQPLRVSISFVLSSVCRSNYNVEITRAENLVNGRCGEAYRGCEPSVRGRGEVGARGRLLDDHVRRGKRGSAPRPAGVGGWVVPNNSPSDLIRRQRTGKGGALGE